MLYRELAMPVFDFYEKAARAKRRDYFGFMAKAALRGGGVAPHR